MCCSYNTLPMHLSVHIILSVVYESLHYCKGYCVLPFLGTKRATKCLPLQSSSSSSCSSSDSCLGGRACESRLLRSGLGAVCTMDAFAGGPVEGCLAGNTGSTWRGRLEGGGCDVGVGDGERGMGLFVAISGSLLGSSIADFLVCGCWDSVSSRNVCFSFLFPWNSNIFMLMSSSSLAYNHSCKR